MRGVVADQVKAVAHHHEGLEFGAEAVAREFKVAEMVPVAQQLGPEILHVAGEILLKILFARAVVGEDPGPVLQERHHRPFIKHDFPV